MILYFLVMNSKRCTRQGRTPVVKGLKIISLTLFQLTTSSATLFWPTPDDFNRRGKSSIRESVNAFIPR